MKKKNFYKKKKRVGNNRSKRPMNKEEKRFNKSADISLLTDGGKILKEAMAGKCSEKQDNTPQCAVPRKKEIKRRAYQFPITPNKTFYAILIKNSEQEYGYDSINKGRCVKVEDFDRSVVRITASDGRVGITLRSNIKSMINNKVFK